MAGRRPVSQRILLWMRTVKQGESPDTRRRVVDMGRSWGGGGLRRTDMSAHQRAHAEVERATRNEPPAAITDAISPPL